MQFRTRLLLSAQDFVAIWPELISLRERCGVVEDVLLDPAHFLATCSGDRVPAAVACWSGEQLSGVVYATQQAILGQRTGYAVGGDFVGRGLVVCAPEHEAAVLEAATACLMTNGVHSLHLRYVPQTLERFGCARFWMKTLEAEIPGDTLRLGENFEVFLSSLGKHTRRNIRSCTRKSVEAGIVFEADVNDAEFLAERARMNAESKFAADREHLDRDDRITALHDGGRRMGLRGADGRFVALLCGFVRSGRFHVLTQWNDARLEKLSLSSVLRACAIEHLIGCRHTEILFLGGSSLNLGRFCERRVYRSVLVDRRHGMRAGFKYMLASYCRRLAGKGKPMSLRMEQLCGGFLDDSRLIHRTALNLAAVGFHTATEMMTGASELTTANRTIPASGCVR